MVGASVGDETADGELRVVVSEDDGEGSADDDIGRAVDVVVIVLAVSTEVVVLETLVPGELVCVLAGDVLADDMLADGVVAASVVSVEEAVVGAVEVVVADGTVEIEIVDVDV